MPEGSQETLTAQLLLPEHVTWSWHGALILNWCRQRRKPNVTVSKVPMVLVQSLQEPSTKGRRQRLSLPNKSLVCSGELEARDLHQHKSHETPKHRDIRQPERSLGKVLGASEVSQILGGGQTRLKGAMTRGEPSGGQQLGCAQLHCCLPDTQSSLSPVRPLPAYHTKVWEPPEWSVSLAPCPGALNLEQARGVQSVEAGESSAAAPRHPTSVCHQWDRARLGAGLSPGVSRAAGREGAAGIGR